MAATLVTLWLSNAEGVGAGAERCDRFSRTSLARAERDTGTGRRVVVIGDSYSVGLGLEEPAASWPSRLPGRVHVAGFSGSGFSLRASACGRVSFADRAPAALAGGADLVVVEGGINDFDRTDTEIRDGFEALADSLADSVGDVPLVVVGPPPAPARAAQVPRVDRLLARLAAAHGATYLSMAEAELPYLTDGLHLTAAGHRTFGDAVAARLPS